MFACLEINQREKCPLWERRKPVLPVLTRTNLPGGAPFFRLLATPGKNGALPWAEIERAAGRLRTKMLFPAGITPPPPPPAQTAAQAQLEPGLRAFVPKRLPLLLCMRAAQRVLRAAQTPAQRLRVTVVDSKGVLARSLEPLVPLAGSLRVFTPDFTLYRSAAAQLQHRYGVTLVLSDSVACFAQSHVIIADNLQLFTGRERGLIFAPDPAPLPGCRVVHLQAPQLPETCVALCPPGIDPVLFACALFELCGLKETERLQFARYGLGGGSCALSIEDLARLLDDACGAAPL
jgi:hypothetical protein